MGMIRRNESLNSVKLVWLNGYRTGPIDERVTEKRHLFCIYGWKKVSVKTGTAVEMWRCDSEGCYLVMCNTVQFCWTVPDVSEEPSASVMTLDADDGVGRFFWYGGTIIPDRSVPHRAGDGNINSSCFYYHFSVFVLLWHDRPVGYLYKLRF